MLKTAFTAKPVISRTQTRTLPGLPPKAAEGRTIQICDHWRNSVTIPPPRRVKLVTFALRDVLAVAAQKGHSRRHIRWFARSARPPPHWSIARDRFELQALHCWQRTGRLSGGSTISN